MKNTLYLSLITLGLLVGCSDQQQESTPAEPPPPQVSTPEHLPEPPYTGDKLAGKQLVKQACAGCHGMNGVRSKYNAPFIAGLDKQYIINALRNYANGSRINARMQAKAENLTPEQIADAASYYADLITPWKGAQVEVTKPKKVISLSEENIAAGAKVAPRCNSCHGENGNSVEHPEAPTLAGMPPEYFIYSLKTYFDDRRQHAMMKIFGMGDSLTEKQIEQLAAYYATQIPNKPPTPTVGNAQTGAAFAEACGGCHGIDGNSANPMTPSLTGQPVEYQILAMRDYQTGKRDDEVMRLAMRNISDITLANIAAYYAMQEPVPLYMHALDPTPEGMLAKGAHIAKSCDSCHGKNGNSSKRGIPSLTGLSVRYFTDATIAYRDGLWKHGAMQKMVNFLSDEEIEMVALFYASQKPKILKKPGKYVKAGGAMIAPACTFCHSDEGVAMDPRIPNLNGQDFEYLIEATKAYTNGSRNNTEMRMIAEAVVSQAPRNLVNVAGYFATQPASTPNPPLPKSGKKIIAEQCSGCHGKRGKTSDAETPRLAGQSEGYLIAAMGEYRDRMRDHEEMFQVTKGLTRMEIKEIAAYYARQ